MFSVRLQLCLFVFSCLCFSCAFGHTGKSLNALNRKISTLRTKCLKRIWNLEKKVGIIENISKENREKLRSFGGATSQTLEKLISDQFEKHFKEEIIDSVTTRIETSLAGKFIKQIVEEVFTNRKTKEYEDLVREVTNLRYNLQAQKTSTRYLEDELQLLLSQVQPRDICKDARALQTCLGFDIDHSSKEMQGVTTTGSPRHVTTAGSASSVTHEADVDLQENDVPSRKLLVAFMDDGVYEVDVNSSDVRRTSLTFQSLSSLVYHPTMSRLFYSLLGSLGSQYLDGGSNIMYEIGDDLITKLALDYEADLLFCTTNYPWTVTVLDIQSRSYNNILSLPSWETPEDIAVEMSNRRIFVLIKYHTGNTEIRCYNYLGVREDIFREDIATGYHSTPISAIGVSELSFWYSIGKTLTLRPLEDKTGSNIKVLDLPAEMDDIAVLDNTCYVTLRENNAVVEISSLENKLEARQIGLVGRNTNVERSMCVVW